MHHLSIFNFSTYQARLRLPYWSLCFLILVLVVELLLRNPAITHHLPRPELTLWHSESVQSKIDYLEAFESTHEIDVLFIGNSTTQSGIDPKIFDQMRGLADGTEIGAFNAAIEGLPPYGSLMFLKIYLQYSRPETIILGVTAQDLNSNSPWAQDVTERVMHSPMILAETQEGIRGRMIASLMNYSQLFRYRFVLHQWLLQAGMLPPPADIYFDERGHSPSQHRLSDVPAAERGIYYGKAGLTNYSTVGTQIEAMQALLAYCQMEGIELILVNLPLADNYYANFDSPTDYQHYLSALTQLASDYQVPLWDMENLTPNQDFDDRAFADFNHLNQFGAERLSMLLAERYREFAESKSMAGSTTVEQ